LRTSEKGEGATTPPADWEEIDRSIAWEMRIQERTPRRGSGRVVKQEIRKPPERDRPSLQGGGLCSVVGRLRPAVGGGVCFCPRSSTYVTPNDAPAVPSRAMHEKQKQNIKPEPQDRTTLSRQGSACKSRYGKLSGTVRSSRHGRIEKNENINVIYIFFGRKGGRVRDL
jgi:hypothetical protein